MRAGGLFTVVAVAGALLMAACASTEPDRLAERHEGETSAAAARAVVPAAPAPAEESVDERDADTAASAAGEPETEPGSDKASHDGSGETENDEAAADVGPGTAETTESADVRLDIDRSCVQRGEVLTVTIHAHPNGGVSMVIGYADGRPHGAMNIGRTDADGVYVWRVLVSPDVPSGDATVLVGASTESGQGGGHSQATFVVAGQQGCP